MKYDVFISYARRDYMDENNQIIPNNIVSKIQQAFTEAGISFWIDEDGLSCGDIFPIKIAKQIEAAKVFLLISTEHANQSEWVMNEVATARNFNKKIIPFRYDSSPYQTGVMIYVAGLQYINYQENPLAAIPKLVKAVQSALLEKPMENLTIGSSMDEPKWKRILIRVAYTLLGVALGLGIFFGIQYFQKQKQHRFIFSENDELYVTPHGNCFHVDPNCPSIKNKAINRISFEEAQQLDKRPCSKCCK